MIILLECADGYYLYQNNDKFELLSKHLFKDNIEALKEVKQLQKGKPTEILIKFLKKQKLIEELTVFDQKLSKKLNEKGINSISGELILYREVKDFHDQNQKEAAPIYLSHKLAGEKIKLENGDMIIIQTIRLIDDIDKDINNQCMRIKEWYGMHFPELSSVIIDNISYLETIKKIGHKEKLALKEDLKFDEKIISLSKISVGTKISDEDLKMIFDNIDSVLDMNAYRKELTEYLKEKMQLVAPNLSYLLGEQFAAKLISHCGSFANLVKVPASTFQILGAEKSLFNALRSKSNTPKYGFLFYAPLVSTTNAQNKGRMARMLAAKASILARVDFYSEKKDISLAKKFREYLERRKEKIEKIKKPQKNLEKCQMTKRSFGAQGNFKKLKK
ncbi:Nucleolar protein 58 [Dictyocoela muelleri]|nr:Nucleolar protein 58 [Dictyocoela muelleri]